MLKLLIIFLGIEISHDDLSFPTELKAKHLITAAFYWKILIGKFPIHILQTTNLNI